MKAIIDTSILTHLRLAKELSVLTEIYEELRTSPTMYKEIEGDYHAEIRELVDVVVKPLGFSRSLERDLYGDEKRFNYLVERWKTKTGFKDHVDVEILIAFLFYTNRIDYEMVFANKKAETRFLQYVRPLDQSKIRDIADLPKLADESNLGLWSTERCIVYLENLKQGKYGTQKVRENLKYYIRKSKNH